MSSYELDLSISKSIKDSIDLYQKEFVVDTKDFHGMSFCFQYCKQVDTLISDIYKYTIKKKFKDYDLSQNNIPICMLSMGSYARAQMSAYSDIDLMILYEDIDGFNTKDIIENILHIAWDARLKISHRVHELKDISKAISDDRTIQTAIFESKFICGSRRLYAKFNNTLDGILEKQQSNFILDKVLEYNDIDIDREVYMEFNPKKSIGGIRDVNMLMWIARYAFGAKTIKELYSQKIFRRKEYIQFKQALSLILSIRNNLHILSNKKQDIFSLEFFPDLSENIKTSTNILPQVVLSKKVFFSLNVIYRLCHMYIAKLSRPYLPSLDKEYKIIDIKDKIYINFDFIDKGKINILDEILNLEDKHMTFDGSVFYAISKVSEIDFVKKFSNPDVIKSLLQRNNLYPILRLFYDTQTLGYAFRAFKPILYLGQFDGYHQYPVGFHSLRVLYNLENIEDDFIKSVHKGLSNNDKRLLKFCVLFHDLGKGRKTEHSFVGAHIFSKSAKSNHFSQEDIKNGKILIKYHTFMSQKAYKDDIYDERTINSFCSALPSKRLIDMLYVLTYADNLGTRKNSLTSHKKYLLYELYISSINYLNNSNILKYGVIRNKKEEVLRKDNDFKLLSKSEQKKILDIPSSVLFIKYSKKDILDIAKRSFATKDFSFEIKNEDFLSIEIIRRKPLNLGYLLNKLSFLNLVHLDIFKIFDDIKYFKINFSNKIEEDNIESIKYDISNSFDMNIRVGISNIHINKNDITLDKDHAQNLAKMTIKGKNQKGFFAHISRIFDELNIDIQSAKIHTSRDKRIQDMLLIEKNEHFYLNIDKAMNTLADIEALN